MPRKPGRRAKTHGENCLVVAWRYHVVLLRQEPHIVSETEQALEQFTRFGVSAEQYEIVHVPETAREECPSPGGRPSSVFAV